MKTDLFQHEVMRTSAVFGRKHDVRVVFQGDGAYTDGSTIVLPSLAMGREVEDEAARVIRGYTDHEAGHVRHSDFDAVKEAHKRAREQDRPGLAALHNAMEDIWLETRVMREYPGSEMNLRATATAVNRRVKENFEAGKYGPEVTEDFYNMAALAVTWEGRREYGGPECAELVESYVPEKWKPKLREWIERIKRCESSWDTLELADEVEAFLRDPGPLPEPEPEKGGGESEGKSSDEPCEVGDSCDEGEPGDEPYEGGEPDGESESGDGTDESDGDGTDESADDGEGDGDDADESTGTDESADDSADESADASSEIGRSASGAEARAMIEDFDLGKAIEGFMEEEKLTATGDDRRRAYVPMTTAYDMWLHRSDTESHDRIVDALRGTKARSYDRKVAQMQGEVNAMRRRLERALMARMQRDWDYGREEGRLDSRRFPAAMSGRSNVFKARTDREEMDTALTLLVDLSGSMSHGEPKSRAEVAADCTVAICEALDRTGIAYEVLGFSNDTVRMPADMAFKAMHEKGGFTRYEPLNMIIFKSFDERLFDAKGPVGSIEKFVGSNNSDSEAVLMAYTRLRARPERRRVMMVLSDGEPACYSSYPKRLHTHLRETVEMIRRDGTACMGVGIMTEAVKKFYPEYVVVNRLEDLAGSALRLLAKQLLGERVSIDNSELLRAS